MGDVIDLPARPVASGAFIADRIAIQPVPLNSLKYTGVHAVSDGELPTLADQRSFTSITKALVYAAALSAKHGCPIVPQGAAADFLGEQL